MVATQILREAAHKWEDKPNCRDPPKGASGTSPMLDSPSRGSCFRKMGPWKNWLYRLLGLGYRRAGENIDCALKEYKQNLTRF